MDEPIDAVALGLKRGPRGAVGVALLVVALPIALVAMRSREEPAAVPEQRTESPALALTAPAAPTKRPRVKRPIQPKPGPALVRREREAAPPAQVEAAVVASMPPPVVPPAPVEAAVVASVPLPVEPPAPVEAAAAAPVPPPVLEPRLAQAPAAVVPEVPAAAPPPAPEPEPEAAPTAAELPERDGNGEAIARAIAAEKRAAVRACFESELKQSPKLRGTVVVELDLAPPNRVDGVRVNDDLERAAFTSCVAATMREVRFAALDEEISVSVPYVLTPAAK